jgi:Transposase IS116/IS110/IS902 family
MAKEGVLPTVVDMFGPGGRVQLDEMGLAESYTIRVESRRDLIEIYDREIVTLERQIHRRLRHDRGYQAVQAINGVGRAIAAIIVVEVGDVTRFPTPRHLCSWAGLTPGRRESDRKGHDTGITKHGSKLLRWALIEGISRYHGGRHLAAEFHRARTGPPFSAAYDAGRAVRDGDHRDRASAVTGSDARRSGGRLHASLHDGEAAASLGLIGAPIEGPTHFSQFDPLALALWGQNWFERQRRRLSVVAG